MRLLPVLPGWSLADVPVYAATIRRGEQPAKVRHALELLAWDGMWGWGWLLQLQLQRMNPSVLMTSFEHRRDGLEPALWFEIWGDRVPIFDDFHQPILRDGNVNFRRQSGHLQPQAQRQKADIQKWSNKKV